MPTAKQLRDAGAYVPTHVPDHDNYDSSADDQRATWIVQELKQLLRGNVVPLSLPPTDADPLLTREQAAQFLTLKLRTFDRTRENNPDALKPWRDSGPLRFRLSTLKMFKYNGGCLPIRRGRKPQQKAA